MTTGERIDLHVNNIDGERAVSVAGVLFAMGARPVRVIRDPADAIPWVWAFYRKSAPNPVREGARKIFGALAEGRAFDDQRRIPTSCTTRVLAAQRLCGNLGMVAPEGDTDAESWALASLLVRQMIGERVEVLVEESKYEDGFLVPWTAGML